MNSMPARRLGNSAGNAMVVSSQGLGCAGFSSTYGKADDRESITTLRRALDLGITFFDTAGLYGDGHNEQLLGRAFARRRDEIVISTKFGFVRNDDGTLRVSGDPDSIRPACEASLRRLGTDVIDLFSPHRIDPAYPIEETVGALADLVAGGMVRYIGLCEASAATLRRAHDTHPITALESEWSLWTRDLEEEVLPTARQLGIGIVPYCPLGRGFLTGTIASPSALDPDDYRRSSPRFAEENMAQNMRIVDQLRALANTKGCTPAQLALAWVMAQGHDVVPIPGTRRTTYLEQNAAASSVVLTAQDLQALESIAPPGIAAGGRYADESHYADTVPLPS